MNNSMLAQVCDPHLRGMAALEVLRRRWNRVQLSRQSRHAGIAVAALPQRGATAVEVHWWSGVSML